jgi:hypothetical protein
MLVLVVTVDRKTMPNDVCDFTTRAVPTVITAPQVLNKMNWTTMRGLTEGGLFFMFFPPKEQDA